MKGLLKNSKLEHYLFLVGLLAVDHVVVDLLELLLLVHLVVVLSVVALCVCVCVLGVGYIHENH
jgi:hypothetical protein